MKIVVCIFTAWVCWAVSLMLSGCKESDKMRRAQSFQKRAEEQADASAREAQIRRSAFGDCTKLLSECNGRVEK